MTKRHMVYTYIAFSTFVVLGSLLWRLPARYALFYPIVGGIAVLLTYYPGPMRHIYRWVPWWMVGTVLTVAILMLWEWVKTW